MEFARVQTSSRGTFVSQVREKIARSSSHASKLSEQMKCVGLSAHPGTRAPARNVRSVRKVMQQQAA